MLASLAREYGAEVVDPGKEINRVAKMHQAWWDSAHLAPVGHHRLAEFMEPTLEDIIQRRKTAANPPIETTPDVD